MSALNDMPPLPQAEFCSWHCERDKTLQNPTGCVNAFNYPPNNSEHHRAYWEPKGFHHEPLFTAEQMFAYARSAIAQEKGGTA